MKLKRLGSRQVLKKLKDLGWYLEYQKGSHAQLKHRILRGKVTVPNHRDLDVGTLKSIYIQASISSLF